MTRNIAPHEYDLFVERYAAKVGFSLVDKRDAIEMWGAATVLSIVGAVEDEDHFLDHYATTLGTVVYLPEQWSLDHKLETLVHEATHVLQFAPLPGPAVERVFDQALHAVINARFPQLAADLPITGSHLRLSGVAFAWLYLIEPEERARFEAEAYGAGMEIARMRRGFVPALDAVMRPVDAGAYMLDLKERMFARTILRSRRTEIREGVYRSTAAKLAREVLLGISPELIAEG